MNVYLGFLTDYFDFQTSILNAVTGGDGLSGGVDGGESKFLDPHAKWTIRSVTCTDDNSESEDLSPRNDQGSACGSVDSDDYDFIIRPRKVVPATDDRTAAASAMPLPSAPPVMVVASSHDAVLVRTRDLDDAVTHARSAGRHGLALRRALRHRRLLRRHNLNRLTDEYLSAVLRLGVGDTYDRFHDSHVRKRSTVRRLQLAARATPVLFGGQISMWSRWVREFAAIPGGLFAIREFLPVRGE